MDTAMTTLDRLMQEGAMSEGSYKEMSDSLKRAHEDQERLFEVKYAHNVIVAAIEESRCDNCDEGASVELHSTNTVQSAIMKGVCTAGYEIFGRFLAGEVCICIRFV